MKVEIILAIVWMSLCICERQQRSTVLTDEYKRVLEHFDFSNFDKQEALNYIDRQRYENLIRGKRSHSKFKRNHGRTGMIPDKTGNETDLPNYVKINEATNPDSTFPNCKELITPTRILALGFPLKTFHKRGWQPEELTRIKRGHHGKRKHRPGYFESDLEEGEEEEYDEYKYRRRRKKKKKKKRKRRYWNHWTEWSPCSVTCGRGRKIRWRKCIVKNCTTGELEMGEKTCQLPACNLLTKLLGL